MSCTKQPKTAPFPFNQDSADVILRTSDHVHYHVHSVILSQASPFFRSMFSLPQPDVTMPSENRATVDSTKPIIDIVELSDTLYTLLDIIYPIPKLSPRPFASLEPAMLAAQKYELDLPIQSLKNDLFSSTRLIGNNTLHVWAVACRVRLEDVAQHAASLLALFQSYVKFCYPEDEVLRGVCAGDYFRLREFCRRGSTSFQFLKPSQASRTTNDPLDPVASARNDAFFRSVPYPDVIVRSSDGTEALAHRCVLAMASPVLREKFGSGLPIADAAIVPGQSHAASLPVLQLNEPGDVLWALIDTCYPHTEHVEQDGSSSSLFILARVITAAEKYEMSHCLPLLRARWVALAGASPAASLDAYLIAADAGPNHLAKDAATLLLDWPSSICTQYRAEMENTPALAYHRLLLYYDQCNAVLKAELDKAKAEHPETVPPPQVPAVSFGVPPTPSTSLPGEEKQWLFHPFLDRVGSSDGADGPWSRIAATRGMLGEYMQWRSTESSLSSKSRAEAKKLYGVSQNLSTRLENAIKKVELKL